MFYKLARDYRMRMYHIALNTESGISLKVLLYATY